MRNPTIQRFVANGICVSACIENGEVEIFVGTEEGGIISACDSKSVKIPKDLALQFAGHILNIVNNES